MIFNLNDVYRDKIYNSDMIEMYECFSLLDEDKQEILLRLILMDKYKVNCFENKKINLDVDSIDTILTSCLDEAKVFIEILMEAKKFYGLDYFSRCLLLEDMENKGLDSNLIRISKTHILDKLTYKIIDELNFYQEYYKGFMIKNNRDALSQNLIIDCLSLRVLDLKYDNKEKYEKFLLEIIKVYYKWKKFINDHEGEYLLNGVDYGYMDKIEKLNIDELFKDIEKDYGFLNEILGDYLHYKTEKIEVSECLVDNYLYESCDEKIKTKLKIKNQNDN